VASISRSKAPQPFALVGLTARDPGAHSLLELALPAFALGGLGALSLDVLRGLAGVLALAGGGALLGRAGSLARRVIAASTSGRSSHAAARSSRAWACSCDR
jgi:hypothetical protein